MNNRKLVEIVEISVDHLRGMSMLEVAIEIVEDYYLNMKANFDYEKNIKIEFYDSTNSFLVFHLTADMTEEEIDEQKQMNSIKAKEDKKDDMKELKKILKKYDMEVKEWK